MDIYRLQADVQKKCCYTCISENKCNPLNDEKACNYKTKPDVRKAISKIKRTY